MTAHRWKDYRETLVRDIPQLRPDHPTYRWLVLVGVMVATFMAVLDATIVNVALPKLMSSFGVSVDSVEWVLTAYLLIFSVMLPTSGWLADHFGYKLVFVLGLLLFTASSFFCSLAWDFNILIFFRVLQGIGSGILMPVGMAIITREFPPEKRGIALAFWSVAASASVSLGPTIGGYLIDRYSWHTIFDVNVPVGIVGMIAALIILREQKGADSRRFDLVGFVSLTTFLTSLLLALATGNSAWNTGGWGSGYILACFIIAGVSLVVFLITEFTIDHPLIQLSLFKNFNFSVCNAALFLLGIGMFGSTFLLPIYLQDSLGYTPFQAGVIFLPVGLLQGVVAPIAGWFSDRFTPKIPSILGLLLMAFTFYQFSNFSLFTQKSEITFPLILRGIAIGALFAPLMTMAISEISRQKMAQASGLLNVVRQIGGSFGVAVFGTLLARRTIYHTAMYGEQVNQYSESFREALAHLKMWIVHTAGGSMTAAAGKAKVIIGQFLGTQAFIQATDDVFLLAGIILLTGLIPLLFVRRGRTANHPTGARPANIQDSKG